MKRLFERFFRGMRDLPGVGRNPDNPLIVMVMVAQSLFAATGAWQVTLGGFVFWALYVHGCIERAKRHEMWLRIRGR